MTYIYASSFLTEQLLGITRNSKTSRCRENRKKKKKGIRYPRGYTHHKYCSAYPSVTGNTSGKTTGGTRQQRRLLTFIIMCSTPPCSRIGVISLQTCPSWMRPTCFAPSERSVCIATDFPKQQAFGFAIDLTSLLLRFYVGK